MMESFPGSMVHIIQLTAYTASPRLMLRNKVMRKMAEKLSDRPVAALPMVMLTVAGSLSVYSS